MAEEERRRREGGEKEERRRCHSTSEAPLLTLSEAKSASFDHTLDDTHNTADVTRLLPNRQTSIERRDFSRRLSLTTERMKGTRRHMANSGASFLQLLETGNRTSGNVGTHNPAPMTRRVSVLVDQQRQPIALLHSNGKELSIRPVHRSLTSGSSLKQLFDDPYGVAEEPRTSNISMPVFAVTSPSYSASATDKVEFERQCQWKGEGVKRADYMLLNVTALFIILVIVAAIIFFSLWRNVSGQMWALYLALGVFALLVLLALLVVRLHFYLKSVGFNLLFRQKKCPPAAALSQKKSSERVEEVEDIEGHKTGKIEDSKGEGLEEAEALL